MDGEKWYKKRWGKLAQKVAQKEVEKVGTKGDSLMVKVGLEREGGKFG